MKPVRIFAAAGTLLIVAAAGFLTGSLLRSARIDATSVPLQQAGEISETFPSYNPHPFEISPPHRGYAHRSVHIDIASVSGNHALGFAPADVAGDIRESQPALLYDKDDTLLALPAAVLNATPGTGPYADVISVRLTFTPLPDLPAPDIAYADILVEQYDIIARLPGSALQKDGNSQSYIWEAVRQQDGRHIVIKRPLEKFNVTDGNTLFFESRDYVSDIYILNPDRSLQDGQYLKVLAKRYAAPEFIKPSRIKSAWQDKKRQHDISRDTPVFVSSTGTVEGCAVACGDQGRTQSFIERIKALATPDREKAP